MCLSSCSGRRTEMARRTFTMVDVTEILQHWYAGRPKVEVARSLGVDAKTVRRYAAPAEAAGMVPGGPPVTEEQWRALARPWFPQSGRRHRVWAFSMVLPCSRHLFVRPAVSMTARAWVEAHVAAFEFLGGAPRRLVPDNLKAGVCKPDLYDPKINRGYAELAAHY